MRSLVAKLVVALALVAGFGAAAAAPAAAAPHGADTSSSEQARPADWVWTPH